MKTILILFLTTLLVGTAYGMGDEEDLITGLQPLMMDESLSSNASSRLPVQYANPLNAYRVPNELYAPNWREININGRKYICDFSGRVSNCGEQ